MIIKVNLKCYLSIEVKNLKHDGIKFNLIFYYYYISLKTTMEKKWWRKQTMLSCSSSCFKLVRCLVEQIKLGKDVEW